MAVDVVSPSYVLDGVELLGISTTAGMSAFHVREDWQTERREWTVGWKLLTTAEVTALQSMFAAAQAGDGTDTFTPPGESAVTVRLLDDEMHFQRDGPLRKSTQLRIRELL